MKIQQFKKILAVLALVIAGLFAVSYFLIFQIKFKNNNISNYLNELSFQTERQQNVISLKKMLNKNSLDIVHINNSIVGNDGDVQFIESIEALAHENGLNININSLSFENSPATLNSQMMIFKIKGQTYGSWSGNYIFLEELEAMPFKIKIDKFSMDIGIDPGLKTTSWQSNFEIRVLKYK